MDRFVSNAEDVAKSDEYEPSNSKRDFGGTKDRAPFGGAKEDLKEDFGREIGKEGGILKGQVAGDLTGGSADKTYAGDEPVEQLQGESGRGQMGGGGGSGGGGGKDKGDAESARLLQILVKELEGRKLEVSPDALTFLAGRADSAATETMELRQAGREGYSADSAFQAFADAIAAEAERQAVIRINVEIIKEVLRSLCPIFPIC